MGIGWEGVWKELRRGGKELGLVYFKNIINEKIENTKKLKKEQVKCLCQLYINRLTSTEVQI